MVAPSPTEPVTVTVSRRVEPGREEQFEDWAAGLVETASDFEGFLGAGVLRPGRLGHDWHIVYRFADPADLSRWESSSARARELQRGEDLPGARLRPRNAGRWPSSPWRRSCRSSCS